LIVRNIEIRTRTLPLSYATWRGLIHICLTYFQEEKDEEEEGVRFASFFKVSILLSHCCHTVITLLSHCSDTVVALMLHCFYTVGTLMLHYCYTHVTLVIPLEGGTGGHASRVPLLLHCCYTVVTLVTLLLHCCYTVVTLLLHCYLQCLNTVVTLLIFFQGACTVPAHTITVTL
jgi:hypothetical protein